MTAECICQMLHEMRERDFVAGKAGWKGCTLSEKHVVFTTPSQTCSEKRSNHVYCDYVYYIILYRIILLYCVVLCCIVLYCIVLFYLILFCLILSYLLLFYLILSYILSFLIWSDMILYDIILWYDMTWPLLCWCLSYDIYIYYVHMIPSPNIRHPPETMFGTEL